MDTSRHVNPYIAGSPVTGTEMFFGREDVFSFVRRNLTGRHRDTPIVLYGQRRTGKTSVLYQMHRHLDPRYRCIFIDLHGLNLNGMENLLWSLATSISRGLQRDHQLSAPVPDRATFAASPHTAFEITFLDAVWSVLGGDQHLLLMIDEVVRLHEEVRAGRLEPEVFDYLRHLMQHFERLNFVFSLGSSVEEMKKDYAFLFGVALYHRISFLEPAAARGLITSPAQDCYLVQPDAAEKILQITSGHPYYTQLVCHCLFDRWLRAPKPQMTSADVDAVLAEAIELGSANLTYVWEDSTPEEQAMMAGMAAAMPTRGSPVTADQIRDAWRELEVRLPAGEAANAARNLTTRDVMAASGGAYSFAVDLQRLWLDKHRRLDWVKEELADAVRKWDRSAETEPSADGNVLAVPTERDASSHLPSASSKASQNAARSGESVMEPSIVPAARAHQTPGNGALASAGAGTSLGRQRRRMSWRMQFLVRIGVVLVLVSVLVIVLVEIFAHGSNTASRQLSAVVRWSYPTGGSVDSGPAVSGGTVYVGSDDGKVYALDAARGYLRWSYATGGSVSGPAVSGGTVYVGSWDDKVYALDAATGHRRWSYATGDFVLYSPAVSGGTVYVGSDDGKVYALDAATGHLRWSYATAGTVAVPRGSGVSGPAVSGGTVYVGSDDGKVYALDAATGHLRWSYTTGNEVVSSPAVSGGTVYVGSWDDKVYALDAMTGHLRWSYTTGNEVVSSPAVSGGTVYVGSDDNKVYALDTATGHLRWSYPTAGTVNSSPAVSAGIVYVGSSAGTVYALDAATGQLRWSDATGPADASGYFLSSSPAVSGGTMYIGNDNDTVYALSAQVSSKTPVGQAGVTASCTRGTGFISFANLSRTTPQVDVYLYSSSNSSGRLVQHDLGYGMASVYIRVTACDYSIEMRIATSPASSQPVLSASITVRAGHAYTVAVLAAPAQARQLRVLDDSLTVPKGLSLVRVIQASLSQKQVTFHCSCAQGAPGNITTDAPSGSVSSYAPIPAGTWTMTATGPSAAASMPVTLTAGTVHTEVVIDGPSGIEILNLLNAGGS
jgi:outer membrane protein assembly factor BamB